MQISKRDVRLGAALLLILSLAASVDYLVQSAAGIALLIVLCAVIWALAGDR